MEDTDGVRDFGTWQLLKAAWSAPIPDDFGPRGPIDYFVSVWPYARGLTARPPADKYTLKQCICLDRRISEPGAWFVQVETGSWDHHKNIKAKLLVECALHDKPIAGLLEDLARRGLLDDTLVVCTVAFGSTSFDQDLSRVKDPPDDYGPGTQPSRPYQLAGSGIRVG